jgi:TatD DNase family protein
MKIFKYDTHTHLDLYDDFETKLKYIEENEIYSIVMTNVPKLYKKYKEKYQNLKFIRFSLGLHPELAAQYGDQLKLFLDYLPESRYIGEIGLDYSKGISKEQTRIFERIIESSNSHEDKIISIHSRKAGASVIDIVGKSKNKIILHWFTGNNKELKRAIDKGYYFSINSDMLATKKGTALISAMPSNKLLIESDSPFTKQTRNNFSVDYFDDFHMSVSKILGKSVDETKQLFSENFRTLLEE